MLVYNFVEVEVCHLAAGMNAGVRASGPRDGNRLTRGDGKPVFEGGLDRVAIRLTLPAVEFGSIVFDAHSVSWHDCSPRSQTELMQTLATRIYFTGFMAAGKTTVGRMVANTLGYDFVDLDRKVEERSGMPVAEIFSTQGEAVFRRKEREMLVESTAWEGCVVSLGGGALSSPGAWEILGDDRVVIYLRTPARTLARRIRHGRTIRPLMLDDNGKVLPQKELVAKVREMLERREVDYLKADIVFEGGSCSIGVAVDRIVDLIRKHPMEGSRDRRRRGR